MTLIILLLCIIRWAESTLWHQGALVKHCKELYKAEGISNAAEPGNPTHTRFYVSIIILFILFLIDLFLNFFFVSHCL